MLSSPDLSDASILQPCCLLRLERLKSSTTVRVRRRLALFHLWKDDAGRLVEILAYFERQRDEPIDSQIRTDRASQTAANLPTDRSDRAAAEVFIEPGPRAGDQSDPMMIERKRLTSIDVSSDSRAARLPKHPMRRGHRLTYLEEHKKDDKIDQVRVDQDYHDHARSNNCCSHEDGNGTIVSVRCPPPPAADINNLSHHCFSTDSEQSHCSIELLSVVFKRVTSPLL